MFYHEMDIMLLTIQPQFARVNEDQIVIFSKSPKRHIKHEQHALVVQHNAAVTIKLKREPFIKFDNLSTSQNLPNAPVYIVSYNRPDLQLDLPPNVTELQPFI